MTASRVVPGSSNATMRFSPSSRLINVLLPTLGRPMTATLMPVVSRAVLGIRRESRERRLEQ